MPKDQLIEKLTNLQQILTEATFNLEQANIQNKFGGRQEEVQTAVVNFALAFYNVQKLRNKELVQNIK